MEGMRWTYLILKIRGGNGALDDVRNLVRDDDRHLPQSGLILYNSNVTTYGYVRSRDTSSPLWLKIDESPPLPNSLVLTSTWID